MADRRRRPPVAIFTSLLVFSVVAVFAGGVLLVLDGPANNAGPSLQAAGLLAGVAATLIARNNVPALPADEDRARKRLRSASWMLHSILILGTLSALGAVLSRYGVASLGLDPVLVRIMMVVATVVLWSIAAYAVAWSTRVPPRPTMGNRVVPLAALQLGLLTAIAGAAVALRGTAGDLLQADDDVFLALVGFVLTTAAIIPLRSLPTLPLLARGAPDAMARPLDLSRQRTVMMPIIVAFVLLFAVLLLILVFGAGIGELLDTARQQPLLLVLLVVLLAAMGGAVALAWRLTRQQKQDDLYRPYVPTKQRQETAILLVSAVVALLIASMALAIFRGFSLGGVTEKRWIDLLAIAIMVGLGPYGFYVARRAKRIRQMEERFPDLLRDLAGSHQGGLTLTHAARVAARGDYGPLDPEISKMVDHLSWNVSFEESFHRFGERVNTPLVRRSVDLVLEASHSGGNTVDVLIAAARDAREIKSLERERRLNMGVYALVIYTTFLVFLGVVAVLYDRFVPQILEASRATAATGTTGFAGLTLGGTTLDDYRTFYFVGSIVQAIGNGVLAGLMTTGQAKLGLKHAFWMIVVTWVTFALLLP